MSNSLSLLLRVSEIMHKTLDLNKRGYIILTCATAGLAFGFSRAFLLLVNEKNGMLEGQMGVGPTSQEDASRIWSQMSQENKSLEELLAGYDKIPNKEAMPLFPLVRKLTIPLSKEDDPVIQCLKQKKARKITKTSESAKVSEETFNILRAEEFVCVPLLIEDKAVGVLLADNCYSNRPISRENVESLSFFANQMAVAIWEARLYQELLENQGKLREMERKLHRSGILISLGEVAAHLAHEIRNPLVIIGGFARSIQKSVEKFEGTHVREKIKEKARIIVREVERLENLLTETLEFARLNRPTFQLKDLNEVVDQICNLTQDELNSKNIKLLRSFSPLPYLRIDEDQIKQALFNLIQNAIDSMPQGGNLEIKTQRNQAFVKIEVTDTGVGIPADIREQIFSPFFTTKNGGSGLGLSIVKHIVEQHGGWVGIESKKNKGTSVIIYLPIPQK